VCGLPAKAGELAISVFERQATIRWMSSPPDGVPRMTVGSGSLHSVPLSLDPNAIHPLATSPGELLAGAIGAVFAWFVAQELVKQGSHARQLTAEVSVSCDDGGELSELTVSAIACKLLGRVPNIGQERLAAIAEAALGRCIKTLGLRREALAVTVETMLEGA
jgi:organic hydroperoxide reductase OsmC/OhrA